MSFHVLQRMCLVCLAVVLIAGCGGSQYPENPGTGADAPVMDNVPEPTP